MDKRAVTAVRAGQEETGRLAGLEGSEELPRDIAVSWWRSQMLGIRPEIAVESLRAEELYDTDERLRRSVAPILDELATNLSGTNSSIVLADHRPVILDRRGTTKAIMAQLDRFGVLPGFDFSEGAVGTNAIGTAVEERRLVRVAGRQHYANLFKHLSCYGVPLIHPLTRRLIGVLDLTFPPEEDHPLMPVYMRDASRRIQEILAEWASMRQRAQFDCFVNLGKRGHRAVLSTMDDAVLLNRGARDLNPVDQAAILKLGNEAVTDIAHGTVLHLELGDGAPVAVRLHTEADHVRFAGVVLELLPGSHPRRTASGRPGHGLAGLVGTSDAWRVLCEEALRAAAADAPLLLSGEPGVGKLAVARAVHAQSKRSPVTELDVASVMADGRDQWLRALRTALRGNGTVILRHLHLCEADLAAAVAAEIDRLSPGGRLIGTVGTSAPTPAIGSLLERFAVRLQVPTLRDRREDVEALVCCFARRHAANKSVRFHPDALAKLRSAELADNVRELERIVAGLVATRQGDILAGDLPRGTQQGPSHLTAMELAERDLIAKTLREVKGNKAAAAERLGISRPTLYRKVGNYGIEITD